MRPEMNANVAFIDDTKKSSTPTRPVVYVPTSAVKDSAVFVVADGRALRRPVRTGPISSQGLRVEEGLFGGEVLIINPPADLEEGTKVKQNRDR
jgi:HlyD family secretion protein